MKIYKDKLIFEVQDEEYAEVIDGTNPNELRTRKRLTILSILREISMSVTVLPIKSNTFMVLDLYDGKQYRTWRRW